MWRQPTWECPKLGCLRVLERGAFQLHLRQQALRVEGLKKVFRSGASELVLFENLSFEVAQGEMLAIVGESGAGKSTLLHILGTVDRPSAGDVYFAQSRLNSLAEDEAADFRNREIGFVWQFHYLLPEFTALENVAMPLLMRGCPKAEAETQALGWLKEVGLGSGSVIAQENFLEASSSGRRWHERLSPSRSCCWPTSRPAIWITE